MNHEGETSGKPSRVSKQLEKYIHQLEVEQAQLRDAEDHTRQIAETLQSASLALTKTFDLDIVLQTLLDYLGRLVPYDSATIFLLERDTQLVARAARGYQRWTGQSEEEIVGKVIFDINQSQRHHALVTKQQSLVIPDIQEYPDWGHIASSTHIRNWMGVPLVSGGKTIGLYSLDKTEPHFFTDEHLQLAEALAAQAAVAIQNAIQYLEAQRELTERQRLQAAEHEQRILAEAFRDIAVILNSSLKLDEVLQSILTHVAQVVPYDAGTILMIRGDAAEVTHAQGYESSIIGLQFPLRDTPNLLQILETDNPSLIEDTHTSDIWIPGPETSWVRSSMTAAIHADTQIIGFLSLERDIPYAYTSEDILRLQAFAHQAGVAVRNARLYASVQQSRQVAETLRAANLALTQNLELDTICETLLDWLRKLVPYDSATIFLIEDDFRLQARAVRGYEQWSDPEQVLSVCFDLENGTTMHTLVTTQESFSVPDTTQFPAWVHVPGVEHVRSWLGVPMLVGGRVIGVCSLDSTLPHFFTQEHIELAVSLAAQAAFAIENARLFEEVENQKRYAEQANEAKSTFLASVSHELRTPLTSILGFTKIIGKRLNERIFPKVETDDRKTQRTMDQVTENILIVASEAERLTALINDLLDLAKIEAGKIEWRMESLTIYELVDRAEAATSALFAEKGLAFIKELDKGLPGIVGDKDRLIQVIINLLSNAIKFTDTGSVICRAHQSNGNIEINIIDTGIGMSHADQSKIFERFTQVGDTLTDKPKGTGLGLPICKEIVEQHGGNIWVESMPGQGSTFSFTLPIQAATEKDN